MTGPSAPEPDAMRPEATKMFQEGATALGITYLLATLIGCFLAGLLGMWTAGKIYRG